MIKNGKVQLEFLNTNKWRIGLFVVDIILFCFLLFGSGDNSGLLSIIDNNDSLNLISYLLLTVIFMLNIPTLFGSSIIKYAINYEHNISDIKLTNSFWFTSGTTLLLFYLLRRLFWPIAGIFLISFGTHIFISKLLIRQDDRKKSIQNLLRKLSEILIDDIKFRSIYKTTHLFVDDEINDLCRESLFINYLIINMLLHKKIEDKRIVKDILDSIYNKYSSKFTLNVSGEALQKRRDDYLSSIVNGNLNYIPAFMLENMGLKENEMNKRDLAVAEMQGIPMEAWKNMRTPSYGMHGLFISLPICFELVQKSVNKVIDEEKEATEAIYNVAI